MPVSRLPTVLAVLVLAGSLIAPGVAAAAPQRSLPEPAGERRVSAAPAVAFAAFCRSARSVRDTTRCPRRTAPVTGGRDVGLRVVDQLPFPAALPAGLSAYEVAVSLARDLTSLQACLDWGPEGNNDGRKYVGPVTARCNRAVWGTPNAWVAYRYEGRLPAERFFAPMNRLWAKYESYGAVLRHGYCPEGDGVELVCTGLPVTFDRLRGRVPGITLPYQVFHAAVRLEFAGQAWTASEYTLLSDALDYAGFTAVELQRFTVPGCPLGDVWGRSCATYLLAPSAR